VSRAFSAVIACVLLSLIGSAGCGPSAASRLQGKWEMDASKTIDDATNENKAGAEFFAGLAKELAKNFKVEVEFKSGGAMSTSYSTPLASAQVTKTGTWKVIKASGNDVTLSGKLEGEAAENETKIRFIDNDTIEMIPPAGKQKDPATFRRVKQT
jgi:hypothetical protein